jgi:hypothetical protein
MDWNLWRCRNWSSGKQTPMQELPESGRGACVDPIILKNRAARSFL